MEGALLIGLAGQGKRTHGAAMEAVLCREDSAPASQAGKLKCGLVRFGARVAEEDAGIAISYSPNQLLPGVEHRLRGKEVRGMHQGAGLVRNRLRHLLIAIAQRIDSNPSEKVDIALPLLIGQRCSLAGDEAYWWRAVGIYNRLRPPRGQAWWLVHPASSFLKMVPSG